MHLVDSKEIYNVALVELCQIQKPYTFWDENCGGKLQFEARSTQHAEIKHKKES